MHQSPAGQTQPGHHTPLLHVLHIASGDLWAGAEVQLYTLAKALHRFRDIRVSVVLLNSGTLQDRLDAQGIPVTVLDESRLNGMEILARLVRLIRDQQPDIVHTHRMKENVLGTIAAWRAGHIPTIRTAHGACEHSPPWWKPHKRLPYALDWLCGRYLQHRIVAVSKDLAAILGRQFPPAKIVTIANGIDIDEVIGASTPHLPLEPAGPGILRVGLIGRLVPVKRVDLFIETAKYIKERHPGLDVHFHIFGDGPLRAELEALSQACGTTDRVFFQGHRDDLLKVMPALDIVMMPSDHEGLPMTLLEAMTLKVCIVAHAAGGIPELLENGRCGVLVTEHTPAGYAKHLHRLAIDCSRKICFVENALLHVGRNYSSITAADHYVSLYRDASLNSQ